MTRGIGDSATSLSWLAQPLTYNHHRSSPHAQQLNTHRPRHTNAKPSPFPLTCSPRSARRCHSSRRWRNSRTSYVHQRQQPCRAAASLAFSTETASPASSPPSQTLRKNSSDPC
eukprot:1878700-Pleurochrysis_carterae.AAC.1